jgi:hypothetical protein
VDVTEGVIPLTEEDRVGVLVKVTVGVGVDSVIEIVPVGVGVEAVKVIISIFYKL